MSSISHRYSYSPHLVIISNFSYFAISFQFYGANVNVNVTVIRPYSVRILLICVHHIGVDVILDLKLSKFDFKKVLFYLVKLTLMYSWSRLGRVWPCLALVSVSGWNFGRSRAHISE